MLELFKIDLYLLRKKFKIYGLFNVLSLVVVAIAIIVSVQWIKLAIGHYDRFFLIIAVMLILIGENLFKEKQSNKLAMHSAYFRVFSREQISMYVKGLPLALYYLFSVFLLFIPKIAYVGIFLFACFIIFFISYLRLLSSVYHFEKMAFINSGLSIFSILFVLAYFKKMITIEFAVFNQPSFIMIWLMGISIVMVLTVRTLSLFSPRKKKQKKHIKLPFIKSWNMHYVIRKGYLIESLLLIYFSNLSFLYSNNYQENYYSFLVTFTLCGLYIMYHILRFERKKLLYFFKRDKRVFIYLKKWQDVMLLMLVLFVLSLPSVIFTFSVQSLMVLMGIALGINTCLFLILINVKIVR